MTGVDTSTSGALVLVLLLKVLLLTPPNEAVVHPGTGSTRWFLRVAVMGMWDGAAASNDEEEGAQDEDLQRTTLPATGICRVEDGAADVTHAGKDAADASGTQPRPRVSRARARCSARTLPVVLNPRVR